MALTAKQLRFCAEYLLDLNATQAAIRAGYSANAANKNGPRMLVNAGIAAEIERLKAVRAERTELTADWVVCRLRDEAEDRTEAATQGGRIKALELLGKHLGMFREKVEVTGKDGGPIQLTAEQRADAVADILAAAAARITPDPTA